MEGLKDTIEEVKTEKKHRKKFKKQKNFYRPRLEAEVKVLYAINFTAHPLLNHL